MLSTCREKQEKTVHVALTKITRCIIIFVKGQCGCRVRVSFFTGEVKMKRIKFAVVVMAIAIVLRFLRVVPKKTFVRRTSFVFTAKTKPLSPKSRLKGASAYFRRSAKKKQVTTRYGRMKRAKE